MRKNKNRGYKNLRVWQDSKELYFLTWKMIKDFPFDLKKVKANQLGSVDSVQRNIAEGYCRKGINDYLKFLDYALSSLGESVSSMEVYREAGHISTNDFEKWDQLAYKIENGLIKLIEKLQQKRIRGDWTDSFYTEEPIIKYERLSTITKTQNL